MCRAVGPRAAFRGVEDRGWPHEGLQLWGKFGSVGGVPNKSHSARLGCGEVSDEVVNLGNCGVGWLPDASVVLWEMFVQHRGAGEDEVHPRREDLGE